MSQMYVVGSHVRDLKNVSLLFNMRGVCLTELMVSLATGAIVLAAALDTFNVVQTRAAKQHRALAHQQDLRLGLEVFEQEARLAVADSIVTASPDTFLFLANVNAQRTTTTSAVVPGQSVLAVQDGSGWGEGKSVTLCGQQACEEHLLSRAGQRYQLVLAEPVGLSLPAGASVEVRNRVVYYTKRDEKGALRLMRMVDGGANVLIGELEDAHFSYRDERGYLTHLPSQVKRVVVEIEQTYSGRRVMREVSLRS
ncbi:MAG: hypothetical protein EWM72_02536 [Nitrospira sp.]|nr:MAG: hypothetical protein EWM72_02536 [Nitrospira sp.]